MAISIDDSFDFFPRPIKMVKETAENAMEEEDGCHSIDRPGEEGRLSL